MAQSPPEHTLDDMAEEQSPGAEDPALGAEEQSPGAEDPALGAQEQSPGAEDPVLGAEEQSPGAADPVLGAEEQSPGAADPDLGASGPDSSGEGDGAAPEQPADAGERGPDGAGGGAASKRGTLCRSSTDKVFAGVAGGIGAYFGIDAVIVRIAFIVLTFMGGAGPFLYLIGWLALPRGDSRSVIGSALGAESPHRFRSLLAVALIGVGLLITAGLSDNLFKAGIDVWMAAPFLALFLIAAGVALVLWPGSAGRPKPTPARSPAPPTPGSPPPSSAHATPAAPPPTAAGPEWPPPPGAAAPAAEPRRRRSMIGSATVAALFVYAGAAVMLARIDVVGVDLGVFFAVALAVTGAGLLASAFTHPARGLIVLGVALAAPLLLFVSVGVPRGSGVGEARVRVVDVEELEDEYRHGIGQLVVDLRHLDPERIDHSVDLSLGVGGLRVYVPASISTTAAIDVGAGNIRMDGSGYESYSWSGREDGLDISSTLTVPAQGDTSGELRLDIDVGVGEARLIFVPAAIDRSDT